MGTRHGRRPVGCWLSCCLFVLPRLLRFLLSLRSPAHCCWMSSSSDSMVRRVHSSIDIFSLSVSQPLLSFSLSFSFSLFLSRCASVCYAGSPFPAAGDIREGAGEERCRAPAADGRRRRRGFSSSEHQPRLPRRGQRRARRHAEGHRHARRRAGVKSRQPMLIYVLY